MQHEQNAFAFPVGPTAAVLTAADTIPTQFFPQVVRKQADASFSARFETKFA